MTTRQPRRSRTAPVVLLVLLLSVSGLAVFSGLHDQGREAGAARDEQRLRAAEEAYHAQFGTYALQSELVETGLLASRSTILDVQVFGTFYRLVCGTEAGDVPCQPAAHGGGRPWVPSVGAYLGVSASTRAGETAPDAVVRTEAQIGRRLAIDHQLYRWDETLPAPHQTWDVNAGRIPYVSWQPQRLDGTAVTWTDITSGAEDAWIADQADRIRDFGHPMFMTLHPEPRGPTPPDRGSPGDFVAAWRRVVDAFRHRGATNVAWVYHQPVSGRPDAAYPGDHHVDWMAVAIDDVFTDWASAADKPVMVAGWGNEEDPPPWIDARAWLESHPSSGASCSSSWRP